MWDDFADYILETAGDEKVKIAEVGIGKFDQIARKLSCRKNITLIKTDILPKDSTVIRDDITNPNMELYEGTDFQYQRRFTYVQLPMLTHIFFGNNRMKGFFNAGPELGYMIAHSTSANFDYAHFADIEGFPTANRHNEQLNLDINSRFDYGISAGLGMELSMTPRHSFSLEGRFYYGLRDVFSNHKKDPFSGSSGMSIMVTLGYFYQLK